MPLAGGKFVDEHRRCAENGISCFQAYDQKNIRRRVYDALNVLMAMNIISKEKKEIRWIGLPTNSAQECTNLELERQRRAERIKQKTQQLQELILQVKFVFLPNSSPYPFPPLSPFPTHYNMYFRCLFFLFSINIWVCWLFWAITCLILLLWFLVSGFYFQQIAFKNLVQRNREREKAHGAPAPNSAIQLPYIIVNTSKKTVIDCSISNDKSVM